MFRGTVHGTLRGAANRLIRNEIGMCDTVGAGAALITAAEAIGMKTGRILRRTERGSAAGTGTFRLRNMMLRGRLRSEPFISVLRRSGRIGFGARSAAPVLRLVVHIHSLPSKLLSYYHISFYHTNQEGKFIPYSE